MNKKLISLTNEYEVCERCKQTLPSDYFDGFSICRICRPVAAAGAPLPDGMSPQEHIQKKTAELTARQVMATLTRDSIDVPHTSELAAAMIKRFKGLEGYADEYYKVVNSILKEKPASALALKAVENIAKLLRDSTIMRDTAPDVKTVSDEVLEAELTKLLEKGINEGRLMIPEGVVDNEVNSGKE